MDKGRTQTPTPRYRAARHLPQTIFLSLFLLTVAIVASAPCGLVHSQETIDVDVAVDSISVPSGQANVGDTVKIVVTVGNSTGSAASSVDVVLRALPSGGNPVNIGIQNVSVGAESTTDVSFNWDTTGTEPGNYTFQAVALLDGSGNDADQSNNFKLTTTPLAIVSPPAKDVAVTQVDVPAGPVTQGDQVTVTVTVENLGAEAASSVSVTLLDTLDMKLAGPKTVASIAVGASSEVTLPWDTSSASPGDHTLKAAAILEGDENNGNDSLDAATPITVIARPAKDVAVTAISLPAGPVDGGDIVDVEVTVENKGTETVSVTLAVVDTQGLTQIAEKEIEDLASGESVTETVPWDSSGATTGMHHIQATATVKDEETAQLGNNSLVSENSIAVIARPAKDVAVTQVDVPAGPVTQGDQVSVTVTVENLGAEDASSVSVTLLDTLDMKLAGPKTVASIAAGDSSEVTLSWDTSSASAGDHTLKAAAILDGDENNDNDSLDADTSITVKARPAKDIAVTAISLPAGPVDGGAIVDVEVTVENKGTETVSVTLAVVDTQGLTQIAEKEIEDLASGESVTETVPWDSSGATTGMHHIQATATVKDEETAQLGNNSLVSENSIAVVLYQLTLGDPQKLPDAFFGRKMVSAGVETNAEPLPDIVTFESGAEAVSALSPPPITTSPVLLEALFAANSQASFGSGFDLQNPFELGHIRGVIRLEERESSIGAHVIVGGQTFFAQEDGAFDATLPMGNYEMEIRAPGYVSVRITGIRLGIGGEVTIRELTLPFGDANGDGRIDIFDLSIAAGNFGATAKKYSLP